MWLSKMKFKPKLLAVMLIACAAIASIASWLTGLNVWILMAIVVAGVLVNGLVATLEDKNKEP
jgi:4-hydroxybenzoate polyprenyltransferase